MLNHTFLPTPPRSGESAQIGHIPTFLHMKRIHEYEEDESKDTETKQTTMSEKRNSTDKENGRKRTLVAPLPLTHLGVYKSMGLRGVFDVAPNTSDRSLVESFVLLPKS